MFAPKADRPNSEMPITVVGGSKFGRFPKITDETTFNMIVSDGFLVPYAGYKRVMELLPNANRGRGIYSSTRGNLMIAVVDNFVYRISGLAMNLTVQRIFTLNSYQGDVFIDENVASQIAICDGINLWIYNWATGNVAMASLPINPNTGLVIRPGYVTYHDGYFIVPDTTSSAWYLSAPNNGLNWLWGAGGIAVSGAIQTKPDDAVAVLRAPGRGNLIYVFGRDVVEMWYDNGGQIFPYQRSTSTSIDYGCLSASTIAAMDDLIVWLAVNERSGPVIMITSGSGHKEISTDGIEFRLDRVRFPEQSYGFLFKDSGHVFYQLTFYNKADNVTFIYDFTNNLFFMGTDEYLNYHIAAHIAFYDNTYYFVSINDGFLYQMSSDLNNYDYTYPSNLLVNPNVPDVKEIPRIRICPPVRQNDASRFVVNAAALTIEMGDDPYYPSPYIQVIGLQDGTPLGTEEPVGYVGYPLCASHILPNYVPRIDLSISKDGSESFSSYAQVEMNALGSRPNRVNFWQLGAANDFVMQFRVYSLARVVVTNGTLQIRDNIDIGGRVA